jgi:thymidine phosphorylase
MSALGSLGTAIGAGATILGNVRQAQQQNATNRAQLQIAQQQATERQAEIAAQQGADALSRSTQLAHATASVEARAASSGQVPYDGSAAAIASGKAQEAAAEQGAANARFAAQYQAIAPNLLQPDATTTALLRSGRAFGGVVSNLLD